MYYFVRQFNIYGDIMKTETISTRIDPETKLAFTSVCEDMGLSPSQAIKLFAKAVINHGGIPFELKAKQPNEATTAAIAELESGKGEHTDSVEALFEDLDIGKLGNA